MARRSADVSISPDRRRFPYRKNQYSTFYRILAWNVRKISSTIISIVSTPHITSNYVFVQYKIYYLLSYIVAISLPVFYFSWLFGWNLYSAFGIGARLLALYMKFVECSFFVRWKYEPYKLFFPICPTIKKINVTLVLLLAAMRQFENGKLGQKLLSSALLRMSKWLKKIEIHLMQENL